MRRPAWISLFTAATLLCYPTYSLVDAINQAQSSGLVEVMSIRSGRPRENVPWPHAWAYFSGLFMVSVGLFLCLLNAIGVSNVGLRTILLIALGSILVLLSGGLSSLAGAAALAGGMLALALTFRVMARFGRVAGLWFWALLVITVPAVVYLLASAKSS